MWKMNYTRKTLDDLAGGDDKIFVVIDDRDDVWLKETGQMSENLLKINAYYYTKETHHLYKQASHFEKLLRECGVSYDLDLSLLCI